MNSSDDKSKSRWAYTQLTRRDFAVSPAEAMADDGWRGLLIEHMSFHALDERDRNRVVDQLAQLENEILKNKRLDRATDNPSDRLLYVWSGIDTRILSTEGEGRRLIIRQARLMEQAFELLRLDRYANAPANRGIMNLFRAWGSSLAFNVVLEESRAVFGKPFIAFYVYYLRGQQSIDKRPVPHPWDRDVIRAQTTAAQEKAKADGLVLIEYEPQDTGFPWKLHRSFAGEGYEETFEDFKGDGPGIYLDSGIIESQRDEEAQVSASMKEDSTGAKEETPKA